MAVTREAPIRLTDTLPPDCISDELAPAIEKLGLTEQCRQLAMEGWTVVEDVADPDVTSRLREAILATNKGRGGKMLLTRDPVFAEAVLNPKLLSLAEFSTARRDRHCATCLLPTHR